MTKIDIINQQVVIEVRTHEPDPRQKAPWTWGDITSGRVTWGVFRNSRWSHLINEDL